MSVQEDLAARRATYEAALNKVAQDVLKINKLEITEETREYYNELRDDLYERSQILMNKINEIIPLQVFTLTLYSANYNFTPATITVAGTDNVLPEVTFDAFSKFGLVETEKTFDVTICGYRIKFEHDGNHYVEVERTGDFVLPSASGNINMDGDGDRGDDDLNLEQFEKLLADGQTIFDGYHFTESLYYIGASGYAEQSFKSKASELEFKNCKFAVGKYAFYNQDNLKSIRFENCSFENTDLRYMFANCDYLESVEFVNVDTSNIDDFRGMFTFCPNLKKLDLTSFDTKILLTSDYMFSYCSSLEEIDMSSFVVGKLGSLTDMFRMCSNLVTVYADYDFTIITTKHWPVFEGCVAIVGGEGTKYDPKHVTSEYARVDTMTRKGYFSEKE